MSTNLIRLEDSNNDPFVGGVLLRFDSGAAKTIAWRSEAVISPALDAAKQYAAQVIEALVKDNDERAVRDTNWASVTAALYAIIRQFNGRLVALERERSASPVQ